MITRKGIIRRWWLILDWGLPGALTADDIYYSENETVAQALQRLENRVSELESDLEEHELKTITHGTESDIVGKDDEQTLTNKTISGGEAE